VANHCTVPGCLEAVVEIPGGTGEVNVTIDYAYDPLYRLTAADYSTGEFFHYTYDAVGNRLTQETHEGSNVYAYDIANRLIEVDGVSFVWDNNGNLLSDGVSSYSYDHANRLVGVSQGADQYEFGYNGLGDRLRQTVNGAATDYTLDIVSGLTQVLADGTNAYLYGVGRVGEQHAGRLAVPSRRCDREREAAGGCCASGDAGAQLRAVWGSVAGDGGCGVLVWVHGGVGGCDGVGVSEGEVL